MAKVKMCHMCRQQFKREELIDYARAGSKTSYSFCPACLKKEQEKEWFYNEICKIFGVKAPGPQINAEHKRIQDTYGYTDQTIIDCLHYVYEIEKIPQKKVTLYFVNPTMIEKMMKYKRMLAAEGNSFAQAIKETTQRESIIVKVREATPRKPEILNPDEFLDD